MQQVKLATAVIVVALLFMVGTLLAPVAFLASLPSSRRSVTFKAMNRLCGAMYFGLDGKTVISAACGLKLREDPTCQPCAFLCKVLNYADRYHCEREARE